MTGFYEGLLAWYAKNKRDLPWRDQPDAYAVWVSEIMLQQTRVETVIPYFERWMARFPTITDLASASQQQVLAAWEGLGYYSRARNLHKAAQIVREEYSGSLPADLQALRSLPGIGPYTAGAIASIAFGLDEPVVDGNIRRLFARIFDVQDPLGSSAAERRFWDLAQDLLPSTMAGEFNQALMDLGATVCMPHEPHCPACPLKDFCQAYERGLQAARPVKKQKHQIPHYLVAAAVIEDSNSYLIVRRPEEGLLGGLWEFPGGKVQAGESLGEGLKREIAEELGVEVRVGESCGVYEHAYTHFRITLHAFHCELLAGDPQPLVAGDLRWALPRELPAYPMGKIDRQISEALRDR
jgi:A/G-specific adenine glycosylase